MKTRGYTPSKAIEVPSGPIQKPETKPMTEPRDEYVERVCAKHRERMAKGHAKYGVTLERNDLSLVDWLNHLQEELMDAAVYVERLLDGVDAYEAIDREGDQ